MSAILWFAFGLLVGLSGGLLVAGYFASRVLVVLAEAGRIDLEPAPVVDIFRKTLDK